MWLKIYYSNETAAAHIFQIEHVRYLWLKQCSLCLCFLNVIPLHVNWDTEVDGQLQPWTHAVFVPALKPWHHILCTGSTRPQLPAWHRQPCVNICSNGTGSYSSVVWHENPPPPFNVIFCIWPPTEAFHFLFFLFLGQKLLIRAGKSQTACSVAISTGHVEWIKQPLFIKTCCCTFVSDQNSFQLLPFVFAFLFLFGWMSLSNTWIDLAPESH